MPAGTLHSCHGAENCGHRPSVKGVEKDLSPGQAQVSRGDEVDFQAAGRLVE
jgi:hypothetical protein